MDYNKKQKLINRICGGGYFFKINGSLYYMDLVIKAKDLLYIDFIKEEARESALKNGVPTNDEMLKFYIKNGKWSISREEKINDYKKQIEFLKDKYYQSLFNEKEKKVIKDTVKSIQLKIAEILTEKHHLLVDKTAEYMAEKAEVRGRFLLMVKTKDGACLPEDMILNNSFYREIEAVFYSNMINTQDIREIARTNPWRINWAVNKNSTDDLFNIKGYELTQEQSELCYYSKFYDSVFESHERPSDEIIDDDFTLDIWWEKKIEEYSNKTSQSTIPGANSKHKEVFVMTDKEGAKKVYNLNDKAVKAAMKQRTKIIQEKGSISEGDLVVKTGRINSTLFVEGKENGKKR